MERSLTTTSVTTELIGEMESCVIEFVLWGQKQMQWISNPNALSHMHNTVFQTVEGSFERLPAQLTPDGYHKLKESSVIYCGQKVEKNIKSRSSIQHKTIFFFSSAHPHLSAGAMRQGQNKLQRRKGNE